MEIPAYDSYFSIGDAVAGLGIFLLIPQFLKPIYIFRLRVLGIGLRPLYVVSAIAFFCVIIGSLTLYVSPYLGPTPLLWELVGGFLFALAYTALAWVSIFPARATARSIGKYVRAGSNLLASASEEDRVEFAADILANIRKFIRLADLPATRKRSRAVAFTISEKRAAEASFYSEAFLRILADPVFCRTLVTRLPWDAARLLRAFAEEKPAEQVGRNFVHQIARYVVISPESVGTEEADWYGFSGAPPLSKAAFGDTYLNRHYLPWEAITATDYEALDAGLMERVDRAARLTIDDQVADRFSYRSYNIARLQENYEVLSRRILLLKKAEPDITPCANILGRSVKYIVESTRTYCRSAKDTDGKALFASDDAASGFSALDSIAELVISVLENIAHEFSGFEDKFWPMAREIWDAALPRFGAQPEGMDALQQRVTLKLIEKTRESMEGWYSPLPRLALALIGPYAPKGETAERSAFKICRDMFYRELKAYPAFQQSDPERAKTLLPSNVRYDPATSELIHRYSYGQEDHTNLNALEIASEPLAGEPLATERMPTAAELAALANSD
jgi:hypothetical protein